MKFTLIAHQMHTEQSNVHQNVNLINLRTADSAISSPDHSA